MSTDAKSGGSAPPATSFPARGVKIFTYPKIIFIWPTMIAAIISAIIMATTGNHTEDPRKAAVREAVAAPDQGAVADRAASDAGGQDSAEAEARTMKRFTTAQNIAGVLFLAVFMINLIIMSVDFPRFTIIALILGGAVLLLGFLYLNVYFDLLHPLADAMENIYAVGNAALYAWIATIILINFAIIWVTRYLDFWVVMPNEILHNHGPFSDLERFPTFNLKFDKEIPDILEYALLGAGRLVLHVATERRAIVLDNVLWINSKEAELKKLMSRMDVRITTDQEAAEPT